MTRLISGHVMAAKVQYLQEYTSRKTPDVKIHSNDGFFFEVHKEVFGQTKFLRLLMANAACCPNDEVVVFMPDITRHVLQKTVQFFYSGTIEYENQDDLAQVIDVLIYTLGFPPDMSLGSVAKIDQIDTLQPNEIELPKTNTGLEMVEDEIMDEADKKERSARNLKNLQIKLHHVNVKKYQIKTKTHSLDKT